MSLDAHPLIATSVIIIYIHGCVVVEEAKIGITVCIKKPHLFITVRGIKEKV